MTPTPPTTQPIGSKESQSVTIEPSFSDSAQRIEQANLIRHALNLLTGPRHPADDPHSNDVRGS